MVTLGELVMILDLHRQGLSLSAIARRTGMDRGTVAKYVKCGLEPPRYGPRNPRPTVITPVEAYLRERIAAFPDLNGSRLLREIQERGKAEVAELHRLADAAEAAADGLVGRDPYAVDVELSEEPDEVMSEFIADHEARDAEEAAKRGRRK